MQLYYTTTIGYNAIQTNPSRSLGGFKSSTLVINDDFSNLFDDVSIMTVRNARPEYRAIILRNEFMSQVRKVKVSVKNAADSICRYKMAVEYLVTTDKYGTKKMSNVQSAQSRPFAAQFVDMSEGVVLDLAETLNSGQEVGIWICREIDKTKAREQYDNVCKPDPTDPTGRRYVAVERLIEEAVDIVVDWKG